MQTAAQCGISPLDFWKLTPVEINEVIAAHVKNEKNKLKRNIISAFYGAYFYSKSQSKAGLSSGDLDKVLRAIDGGGQMTDEEMYKTIVALNKQYGGNG